MAGPVIVPKFQYDAVHDTNDGKEWSQMDLDDLQNALARGGSIEDFAWTIIRLTASPAKQIGRVYAPDETSAIAKAIEEFGIPEAQRSKLAARRAS